MTDRPNPTTQTIFWLIVASSFLTGVSAGMAVVLVVFGMEGVI